MIVSSEALPYHPTDTFTVTQISSTSDQLAVGVRFLDLRLGWRNARVEMYHGAEALDLSFVAAAQQIDDLLHDDTEFVMVPLEMDAGPHENIRNWIAAHDSDPVFSRFRWDADVPTYGTAEGRAVVLDRGIGRDGIAPDVPDSKAFEFDDETNVAAQTRTAGSRSARPPRLRLSTTAIVGAFALPQIVGGDAKEVAY